MNTLNWNTLIAGSGPAGQKIASVLQSFFNALNLWQAKEHDPTNGTHADVTATSLRVNGLARVKRFGFDPTFWVVFPLVADGVIVVDQPYSLIKVTAPGAAIRIDGLFHALYQPGDMVALMNATDDNGGTGTNLTIRLQSNAAANAQLRGNPGVVNDDYTLKPGRGVLLFRDRNSNGAPTSNMYWRSASLF